LQRSKPPGRNPAGNPETIMRTLITAAALGAILFAGAASAQNFSGNGTPPVQEVERIYAHPPQIVPPGVYATKPNSNERVKGAIPTGPDRSGVELDHPDVQG
jgi:hypothetical protein